MIVWGLQTHTAILPEKTSCGQLSPHPASLGGFPRRELGQVFT